MKHLLLTAIAAVLLVGCQTISHRDFLVVKSAIHKAAKAGDIEVVKALLDEGVDVNSKYFLPFEKPATHNLGTPLHFAVEGGHIKISPLIIQPISP